MMVRKRLGIGGQARQSAFEQYLIGPRHSKSEAASSWLRSSSSSSSSSLSSESSSSSSESLSSESSSSLSSESSSSSLLLLWSWWSSSHRRRCQCRRDGRGLCCCRRCHRCLLREVGEGDNVADVTKEGHNWWQ